MKKKFYVFVLTIFLSSCASLSDLAQLIRTPTPAPPPDTPTPAPSITPAPTQNLFATSTSTPLTYTPTVTQIGAENFTPTGTATDFPTPIIPKSVLNGNSLTPVDVGFLSVLISNGTMYWNEGPCMPREIKVSAFVEDIPNTHMVLLFTRLREKKNTLNITDWNSGAIMIKADNGSFNYTLHTWNIRRYYLYKDAWLEYQLVSFTKDLEVIGRTRIYDRNLSLVRCVPVQ